MTTEEKSIAHGKDMNHIGNSLYPDGLVPWRDETAPDIANGKTTGRLRSCGYCGSMHPADVANAIRAGAKGSWADCKYGWPHKAYFDKIPNPHAGMMESRVSCSHLSEEQMASGKWIKVPTGWIDKGAPAPATTYGKFYSVHLQDATPEDREVIEKHLGLAFDFTADGKVSWRRA